MDGQKTFNLNSHLLRDGDKMPSLGMGTFQLSDDTCRDAVATALDLGVRHIDTARMYENEVNVGKGIRASGVDRDEIFLTSKLQLGKVDREGVRDSCENSLRDLGTEYLDLLLIHWPDETVLLEETLGAMAMLREEKKIRHVGVSNFPVTWLDKAVAASEVPIFCNQVECHPFIDQSRLLDFCGKHDIIMTAYSPLARGKVADNECLRQLGKAHGKTPAQVALRWLLQHLGVAAIPKASRREHIQQNIDIFDFELTDDEIETIRKLDKSRRLIDPDFAPEWDG